MNVEMNLVEEPLPNYETKMAMEDVQGKKGNKVKDAKDLFTKLGIWCFNWYLRTDVNKRLNFPYENN